MSLQWTLVAGVLYGEIALTLFLIFPIFSPRRLNAFLKSRFFQAVSSQAQWYFGVVLLILSLLFLDAIREMRKYTNIEHNHETSHTSELQHNMRLFRAQRNFYISGFALFLTLVIKQIVRLISKQAVLLAENEAALKQAKSATVTARGLLAQTGGGEAAQNSANEAHQKEISKLSEEIASLKEAAQKAETDKKAVLAQCKSLETEYDRLCEEHKKLELKLKVQGEENKKDD